MPYLEYFNNGSQYKWLFLTLSPENYSTYEEGLEDIRNSWKKFLKRKYIKDRIKGGFMVVEVTNRGKGWNFHIHAIIYSRYLDNVNRGSCPYCHQNYLRYNRFEKKFYCANTNCRKLYEGDIKSSRLSREFSESSNRRCYEVDVSQAGSQSRVLNYMLKYVLTQKDSFLDADTFASYIVKSHHKRQITSFWEFYDFKKQISLHSFFQFQPRCHKCGEIFNFIYDLEAAFLYRKREVTNQYLEVGDT